MFRKHALGGQRAAGVNRISVPKHQRCRNIVSSAVESANPQMFAVAGYSDSFHGIDRRNCASNLDKDVNHGPAAFEIP
jgi:hypothetical protein